MLGNNSALIEENFIPVSLTNIQVSGYLVSKLDGSFATAPMIVSDGSLIPMPAGMRTTVDPLLPALMTADRDTANTALFWFNGQAILISGVAITDSLELRAPSGFLFFFASF